LGVVCELTGFKEISNIMYIFFDTETNGLPNNYKEKPSAGTNWPRIIQLAFIVLDSEFNEIESYCELIKPDGWEIPNLKFWIDNGYSTDINEAKGVVIQDALACFNKAIDKCDFGVAHNMDFDYPVIGSEMMRYSIFPKTKISKICTMKSTVDFCAIPAKYNGFKWPKLEELHTKLFGVSFDGAHDALEDVRATVRCFVELKKRGVL